MIKEKIAKLIDLKTIITILMTGGFIYGFVVNKIEAKDFMLIATMIYTFYFSKKKDGDLE